MNKNSECYGNSEKSAHSVFLNSIINMKKQATPILFLITEGEYVYPSRQLPIIIVIQTTISAACTSGRFIMNQLHWGGRKTGQKPVFHGSTVKIEECPFEREGGGYLQIIKLPGRWKTLRRCPWNRLDPTLSNNGRVHCQIERFRIQLAISEHAGSWATSWCLQIRQCPHPGFVVTGFRQQQAAWGRTLHGWWDFYRLSGYPRE